MKLVRAFLLLSLFGFFGVAVAGGREPVQEAMPNWPAPATWSPSRAVGVHTLTDVTSPLPFIGLSPCRIADTRGNGFSGSYGPPSLAANTTRTFVIAGQCGIPASAAAVSFNFGALNIGGAGDLRVFPDGGSVPLVSTMNYNANTPNIANAAIVPLGTTNGITVRADAVSIDLIIDVNGYFASNPINNGEVFAIVGNRPFATLYARNQNSGGYSIWGDCQTCSIGVFGTTNGTGPGTGAVVGGGGATSGTAYGVAGYISSNGTASAGVYGVDLSGDPGPTDFGPAGVRGGSTNGIGVLGLSTNSGFGGVVGSLLTSAGTTSGGTLGYSSSVGVHFFNGLAGDGVKSFVEPHPTDPSKVIRYVSLEGPESGTYFRGRGRFQRGLATIEPPEDFRMVTDPQSLSIQVTPIGEMATVAVVRIGSDAIVVKGSRDVEFFYLVNGVRRAYKEWNPIQENEKFFVPESPQAKLPKYLSEEERGRLIANGTYNADGTVNMETAERVGWAKAWRDREEQAKAAAAANVAARAARLPERK